MVPTPVIFTKARLMRLKMKRLGPIIDPKEGRRDWALERATEAKDEDDNPQPLTWKKGKKIAALERESKLLQAIGLLRRGQRYTSQNFINLSFPIPSGITKHVR